MTEPPKPPKKPAPPRKPAPEPTHEQVKDALKKLKEEGHVS
jgi:hypothetical protein